MKKALLIVFFVFGSLGIFGKIYAIAQDTPISPKVEPVLQVESATAKSGEIDKASVKVKTEEGEQTLEEKIRNQILTEMADKEKELKDREMAVTTREDQASALEARVKIQVGELKEITTTVEDAMGVISKKKKEDVAKLANMYSAMKAKEAAAIMNTLDSRLVVEIIDNLSPTTSGGIMGVMDTKKVRDVTSLIYARGSKIKE